MTLLQPSQISALSRLFSSSVIRELSRHGKSPLFARLAHESFMFSKMKTTDRVCDLFEDAFTILKEIPNRNEYIYKSAITQNILLGKHSLNSACILSEFRVQDCKADVAILNGTSTAYEIKSERDSLSRLERQISSYRKVFANVYVIAGENHLSAVQSLVSADVGIMRLSKRYQITVVREAAENSNCVDPAAIFDSIRLGEAKQILLREEIEIPSLPNTEMNRALRELFTELPPETAHSGMVETLKRSRNLSGLVDLVDSVPSSLRASVLSCNLRLTDHDRLLSAVRSSLAEAKAWA